MNPVFYQYRNSQKYIDKLIAIFHERGWLFKHAPIDFFHEFYWPDIVLSDKDAKLPDILDSKGKGDNYTIELLGCYEPADNEWKTEGRVVLYIPKIKQTANAYFIHKYGAAPIFEGDAERFFSEGLTTIILIHEFVHWIIHWIESPGFINTTTKCQLTPINYSSDDEISFHESLAQIFTKFIIRNDSELMDIFIWLENRQPKQYTIYNDIVKYENSEKFIGNLLTFLLFVRQYNLQSFEVLKFLLENPIPDFDTPDYLIDEENIEIINIETSKMMAEKLFITLLKNNSVPREIMKTITNLIEKDFPNLATKRFGQIAGKKLGL